MTPAKRRILLVEDEVELYEILNALFERMDCELLYADAGESALRIAQDEPLDLVILDINLPGELDGYDICRQLRAGRRTEHLPIIFLTIRGERTDKLHGLELGVVDYITKPFDLNEVRIRVQNTLERAERARRFNKVTELPEPALLTERFSALRGQSDWAALALHIDGLEALREHTGFAAADDLLRAVARLARAALHEQETANDDTRYFVGHLSRDTLIVIAPGDRIAALRARLEPRIRYSLDSALPVGAAVQSGSASILTLRTSLLHAADDTFDSAEALAVRLLNTLA